MAKSYLPTRDDPIVEEFRQYDVAPPSRRFGAAIGRQAIGRANQSGKSADSPTVKSESGLEK